MVEISQKGLAEQTTQLRESVRQYSNRIKMVLSGMPFHVEIIAVGESLTSLECEWWCVHNGQPKFFVQQKADVAKTDFNYRLDIEYTLNHFLQQAYEIKDMWDAENLNQYLVDPTTHKRELAKMIYEVKRDFPKAP